MIPHFILVIYVIIINYIHTLGLLYYNSLSIANTVSEVWVYAEGSSPLLPALHAILGRRALVDDGTAI